MKKTRAFLPPSLSNLFFSYFFCLVSFLCSTKLEALTSNFLPYFSREHELLLVQDGIIIVTELAAKESKNQAILSSLVLASMHRIMQQKGTRNYTFLPNEDFTKECPWNSEYDKVSDRWIIERKVDFSDVKRTGRAKLLMHTLTTSLVPVIIEYYLNHVTKEKALAKGTYEMLKATIISLCNLGDLTLFITDFADEVFQPLFNTLLARQKSELLSFFKEEFISFKLSKKVFKKIVLIFLEVILITAIYTIEESTTSYSGKSCYGGDNSLELGLYYALIHDIIEPYLYERFCPKKSTFIKKVR